VTSFYGRDYDDDGQPVPEAAVELAEFLADGDGQPEYDWLVPGLLERRDRVILTGSEGRGKMTLLRQIAVQLASGIHPFTLEPIDPLRVLLLDLQETERQLRRELRPLRISAGDGYAGHLYVASHPQGFNVLDPDDAALLRKLVAAWVPDVLVAGPVYKLADGDPTDEASSKQVARLLDEIRMEHGPAMLLEAHSPYATGRSSRPQRPYGWSGWCRWPEFGLCLTDRDELAHWRGPRDQRAWPVLLKRGGQWPFTVETRDRDVLWAKIAGYCADAGEQLTERDLAQLTGKAQMTVHRAIDEHRAEWAALGRTTESGE
jgi:hypothetical protein